MRFLPICQTVAALLAIAPVAALADEVAKPDAFVLRFLGKDPSVEKVGVCFKHVFGRGYLDQHPRQTVTAMTLFVTGEPDVEAKSVAYSFKLGVELRHRTERYLAAGGCEHSIETQPGDDAGPSFSCGGDCGGSNLEARLSDDGKAALLTIEEVSLTEMGKDEGEHVSLSGTGDDRTMTLERADLADCRSLTEDGKEAMLNPGERR